MVLADQNQCGKKDCLERYTEYQKSERKRIEVRNVGKVFVPIQIPNHATCNHTNHIQPQKPAMVDAIRSERELLSQLVPKQESSPHSAASAPRPFWVFYSFAAPVVAFFFPSYGSVIKARAANLLPVSVEIVGWEAGIRTPIGGSRVRSLTVRRPPKPEFQFTCRRFACQQAIVVRTFTPDRRSVLVVFLLPGQNRCGPKT
jgi:hypothetical protein